MALKPFKIDMVYAFSNRMAGIYDYILEKKNDLILHDSKSSEHISFYVLRFYESYNHSFL